MTWLSNPEARATLERIIAEKPDYRIRQNKLPAMFGGYLGIPDVRYLGTTAARLRRIYNQAGDELLAQADAAFDAGTPYAEAYAEFNAWVNDPPDKVIADALGGKLVLPIERARHVLTDRVVKRRAA